MNIKQLLGKRLKAVRQAHGYTQEALAEKLNMSCVALSKVERGQSFISPNLLENLCEVYNVNPIYFFNFESPIANNDFEKLNSIIKKLKSLNSTNLSYVYKFIDSL